MRAERQEGEDEFRAFFKELKVGDLQDYMQSSPASDQKCADDAANAHLQLSNDLPRVSIDDIKALTKYYRLHFGDNKLPAKSFGFSSKFVSNLVAGRRQIGGNTVVQDYSKTQSDQHMLREYTELCAQVFVFAIPVLLKSPTDEVSSFLQGYDIADPGEDARLRAAVPVISKQAPVVEDHSIVVCNDGSDDGFDDLPFNEDSYDQDAPYEDDSAVKLLDDRQILERVGNLISVGWTSDLYSISDAWDQLSLARHFSTCLQVLMSRLSTLETDSTLGSSIDFVGGHARMALFVLFRDRLLVSCSSIDSLLSPALSKVLNLPWQEANDPVKLPTLCLMGADAVEDAQTTQLLGLQLLGSLCSLASTGSLPASLAAAGGGGSRIAGRYLQGNVDSSKLMSWRSCLWGYISEGLPWLISRSVQLSDDILNGSNGTASQWNQLAALGCVFAFYLSREPRYSGDKLIHSGVFRRLLNLCMKPVDYSRETSDETAGAGTVRSSSNNYLGTRPVAKSIRTFLLLSAAATLELGAYISRLPEATDFFQSASLLEHCPADRLIWEILLISSISSANVAAVPRMVVRRTKEQKLLQKQKRTQMKERQTAQISEHPTDSASILVKVSSSNAALSAPEKCVIDRFEHSLSCIRSPAQLLCPSAQILQSLDFFNHLLSTLNVVKTNQSERFQVKASSPKLLTAVMKGLSQLNGDMPGLLHKVNNMRGMKKTAKRESETILVGESTKSHGVGENQKVLKLVYEGMKELRMNLKHFVADSTKND